MITLHLRNFPEDLRERLRERAAAEGTSISEIVLAAIRRELTRPRLREWIDAISQDAPTEVSRADVISAIAEGRRGR